MTAITYRHTGRARGSLPSGGSLTSFFSHVAHRWQQWRSLRELESLSDDVRKDLGWPAADETKNPKAIR
ncbi:MULTISPECIES: hypothetical protein [Rhizobium]|uniref:DUF1127 domain-containing protein n=1 Tax=Rhizobium miluonense TaxID=411945 RepID=A0A1C3X9F6_9HYPH|nr:hypothetical protein [Rhizobium miluonense]SCB48910.1 hypothetical protein GA0061102_106911 [Rhizobium miluonense]